MDYFLHFFSPFISNMNVRWHSKMNVVKFKEKINVNFRVNFRKRKCGELKKKKELNHWSKEVSLVKRMNLTSPFLDLLSQYTQLQ